MRSWWELNGQVSRLTIRGIAGEPVGRPPNRSLEERPTILWAALKSQVALALPPPQLFD